MCKCVLLIYRVSNLTMKTKVKQFHLQKIDNQTLQIITKLNPVPMLILSKMHQSMAMMRMVWLKNNTPLPYSNSNMNNSLQIWHRNNKNNITCKCNKWLCSSKWKILMVKARTKWRRKNINNRNMKMMGKWMMDKWKKKSMAKRKKKID